MSAGAEHRLAAIAATQHGVFGRRQALDAGLSKSQIDRRLYAARWVRELPRVYRASAAAATAVSPLWAALLWAGTGSVLSHRTAALLWRLEPIVAGPVEITVPPDRAPRTQAVVVHRAETSGDVVHLEGLAVTSPCRTLIDLAGVVDDAEFAVALASARLCKLVGVSALLACLDAIGAAGRPGAARVRRVANTIDANDDAHLEAAVAHLLRAHRLHAPERRRGRFAWPHARFVLMCGPPGAACPEPGRRVLHLTRDDLTRPAELVTRVARALGVPRVVAAG